jgi:hypothetical protein
VDPTHTQPPAAPLMSAEFLVISGESQAYGEDEADEWLAQTGWRKCERQPLIGPASVIVATTKVISEDLDSRYRTANSFEEILGDRPDRRSLR